MSASTERDEAQVALVKTSRAPVPWCDEFIKMISGMNFTAKNSTIMMDIKMDVMKKLKFFNEPANPPKMRQEMAEFLFGKIGTETLISQGIFMIWGCNTFIGDGVFLGTGLSIYDNATVQIGNNVDIGMNVCICTATHNIDPKVRADDWGTSFAKPIVIEDDVSILEGATILAGVTIGRRATIRQGSVVTKDVEKEAIVGGVPAKEIVDFGDNYRPRSFKDPPPRPCGTVYTVTCMPVIDQLPFPPVQSKMAPKEENVQKFSR